MLWQKCVRAFLYYHRYLGFFHKIAKESGERACHTQKDCAGEMEDGDKASDTAIRVGFEDKTVYI